MAQRNSGQWKSSHSPKPEHLYQSQDHRDNPALHWRSEVGTTEIIILPGYNYVPNPFPVACPLNLSNLYTGNLNTGVKAGVSAAAATKSRFTTTVAWQGLPAQERDGRRLAQWKRSSIGQCDDSDWRAC